MDFTEKEHQNLSTEEQKIFLAKEELNVTKKTETEVKVFHKNTVTEDVEIPVELLSENYTVERIPKNEEIQGFPTSRTEGNTTILPIIEERAVVVKKLFLVEEIRITKNEEIAQTIIKDTIRRETFSEGGNKN